MSDELGYLTFPGLEGIESATFALAHGARPGVGMIVARPQDYPPAHYGTMSFHYDTRVISFPNCALDSGVVENGGEGPLIRYRILDRRWAWSMYRISGAYNLYGDNQQIRTDTRKTSQQLAGLCLDAMKETGYDVSGLTTVDLTVDWEFTNAAEALEDICERSGCRIVLGLDNRVRICKLGQGDLLPDTPDICNGGAVIDPPELPGRIEFIGNPDEFQWDFELEAVGKELDGTIKLLNDLSYKPVAGWDSIDIEGDYNEIADVKLRTLAQQWVFRAYRIKFDGANELDLPDLRAINDDSHVHLRNRDAIELLGYQLHTTVQDGRDVARAPVVYGKYYAGNDNAAAPNNTQLEDIKPLDQDSDDEYHKAAPVHIGYGIDTEHLTVHFGEPVFKQTFNGVAPAGFKLEPADLRLRIAFRARDKETNAYEHYREYGSAGGPSQLTVTIRDSNIVRRVYPVWSPEGFVVNGEVDNATEFTTEGLAHIQAKLAEYDQDDAMQVVYESIREIQPDGAIQQVQWQVGGGTSKTTAWRNNDVQTILPDYQHRRARAKTLKLVNVVNVGPRSFRASSIWT